MDIQVGDRITYKTFGEIKIAFIVDDEDMDNLQEDIKNNNIEVLKVERPKYEVVEEKKEKKEKNEINPKDVVELIELKICELYKKCPQNSVNKAMIIERELQLEILYEILDKIKELELEKN